MKAIKVLLISIAAVLAAMIVIPLTILAGPADPLIPRRVAPDAVWVFS